MEDQICSPEMYSIKNSYNKNMFYLIEKKDVNKNVIKMFLTEYKIILIEKKKNFDIMKKS